MIRDQIERIDKEYEMYMEKGLEKSGYQVVVEGISELIRQPFLPKSGINFLVHYTSVDALFSLLGCPINAGDIFFISGEKPRRRNSHNVGHLRLYDTFHANDPSEGTYLVENEPDSNPLRPDHECVWQSLNKQARLPAYISSFRGIETLEEYDDIFYWRTYGKDGMGVALVIPVKPLKKFTYLSQVRYGKKSIVCTLSELSDLLDSLSKSRALNDSKKLIFREELQEQILKSVSTITYLHKSLDYKLETEVRVVSPLIKPNDTLWCEPHLDVYSGRTLRHFTSLPELRTDKLLVSDSKIVLGPAVQYRKNLKYLLIKRLEQLKMWGREVLESKIGYRSNLKSMPKT